MYLTAQVCPSLGRLHWPGQDTGSSLWDMADGTLGRSLKIMRKRVPLIHIHLTGKQVGKRTHVLVPHWASWYSVAVLVSLLSSWHKLELFGKKDSQRKSQVQGSIILISDWCGRAQHPWAGGPLNYKKAGWANYEEQASKQHPSMILGSAPASRTSVWLPVLCSFNDEQWCGSVSQINPSFPKLFLASVLPQQKNSKLELFVTAHLLAGLLTHFSCSPL